MPAYTEPQFCLPIVIPSTVAYIRIHFSNSSIGATTVDATLTAGTYWNDRNYVGASNLWAAVVAALQAGENAVGGAFLPGTWTQGALLLGGMDNERQLKRVAGHANDTITKIEFLVPASLPGSLMGFTSDDVVPDLPNPLAAGVDYYWFSNAIGRLWMPFDIVTVDMEIPVRQAKSARSAAGASVVNTTGGFDERLIVIEFVHGALVWRAFAAKAGYIARVDGMSVLDGNNTLEALWDDHAEVEPIRYFPDSADPTTYEEIEITDEDWLSDMRDGALVEMSRSPLKYRVIILAQEYVT